MLRSDPAFVLRRAMRPSFGGPSVRRWGGMRRIWIRRLLPASVVALVLAFSYIAPALGAIGPGPVQSSFHTNCGRFGYGYHGGKHLFVCPNRPFPGRVPPGAANPSGAVRNPEPVRSASGVSVASGVGQVAGSAAGRLSSGGAVPAGASQWRAFTELL